MPETPKEKPMRDPTKPEISDKEGAWETDQKKRDYYYDDSHGYETYTPEDNEDENEKGPSNQ